MMKKYISILSASVFMFGLLILMAGCENEEPAEKAGKKIDQAVEETGNKIDQAVEEAKEDARQAKEHVEDAVKNN